MDTYYISDFSKNYSVFQVGSYWIYKNEVTGRIDSSFIKIPPNFHFQQYYPSDPIIQVCDIEYGGDFIAGSEVSYSNYYLSFKSNPGGSCLRNEPFQPGKIVYYGHSEILKDVLVYDTLLINNVKFPNVLCTQIQQLNLTGDTSFYTFYLCKSIGLIKYNKSLPSGKDTTWSLLRFHVIQ